MQLMEMGCFILTRRDNSENITQCNLHSCGHRPSHISVKKQDPRLLQYKSAYDVIRVLSLQSTTVITLYQTLHTIITQSTNLPASISMNGTLGS